MAKLKLEERYKAELQKQKEEYKMDKDTKHHIEKLETLISVLGEELQQLKNRVAMIEPYVWEGASYDEVLN